MAGLYCKSLTRQVLLIGSKLWASIYIYTLAPTSVKGKWFAATTLLDFVTLTDPFPSFYFTYIYEIKLLLKLIKLIHFFF